MPATPPISIANGSAALPFASYADVEGNLWISPGPVIALHGTTAVFEVGSGGFAMSSPAAGDAFRPAAGAAARCVGGNGTNLTAATSPLDSVLPFRLFRATGPNTWTAEGSPDLVLTFNPGDGSAELSDFTDVVATLAAGARTDPAGTYTATTHGEDEYNASAAFTVAIAYEGAAEFYPLRSAAVVWTDEATATGGIWARTGWQTWELSGWTLTLDGTGAGEISDGTDVVAERAADAGRLYDPSGQWVATSYGTTTYGAAVPVYEATASAGTFPTQEYQETSVVGTVHTLTGTTDGSLYIEWDTADGDADLYDATGLVAERTSGVSTGDFLGTYTATTQGEDDYNGGSAFTVAVTDTPVGAPFLGRVGLLAGVPAAGAAWVELTLDGSDEVTAAAGPIWGATWPANSATLAVVPIVESDGAGEIQQRQLGPIYWRPGGGGGAGADGLSAYEVAVANGFSGDEAAWLASLEGTDGTNGTNGIDGAGVVYYGQLTSDYTLTSTTAEQKLFNFSTNGAITLATGRYRFRASLYLTTMSATTGNASFRLAGTATLANILFQAVGLDSTTPLVAAGRGGSASVTAAGPASMVTAATGTGLVSDIEGIINVTASGTVIPSIALVTAAAAVVKAGSYVEFLRIGDTGSNTQGSWS
jgi:hypothetical protein